MTTRWDEVVTPHRCVTETLPQAGVRVDDPGADDGQVASISVWLYGALGGRTSERPIRLQLGVPFSTDDVIGELGHRLGDEFRTQVLDAEGRKFLHCRVFVDGAEVEETSRRVRRGAATATVEMILLTAIEGG